MFYEPNFKRASNLFAQFSPNDAVLALSIGKHKRRIKIYLDTYPVDYCPRLRVRNNQSGMTEGKKYKIRGQYTIFLKDYSATRDLCYFCIVAHSTKCDRYDSHIKLGN